MKKNLLNNFEFIPFCKFTLDELDLEINQILRDTKESLNSLEQLSNANMQIILEFLYPKLYKLNQLWSLAHHLLAVDNSEEIRKLEEKLQPIITEFYTNLGYNQKLYDFFKSIKENHLAKLTLEEEKILDNELHHYKLSGITLSEDKKNIFKEIQLKLVQLESKFEQNVIDATNEYAKYVTLEELSGIPENILNICKKMAETAEKSNLYKVTLHQPIYTPIMQYCDNRELRQELYYNYTTRSSEFNNKEYDNTSIINQIINLRNQKANLLGFKNYVDLSTYSKMAENSEQILDFLFKLSHKSHNQAQNDIIELDNFAKNNLNISQLEAWDVAYVSEKLQQAKYSYSNEELKQYFQLPIVLEGLFNLINKLYGIEFKLSPQIPVWHGSVTVYSVLKHEKIIGYLYLDLFTRDSKQPGAWMNSAQDKYITTAKEYLPMAYIMCNFAPDIPNLPSLLTFDDTQTLFHEMGHALHHLLTKISLYPISGINGVEWDAVELPSQFMEYFTWDYEILSLITKHVKTGEKLPYELYQKVNKARYFQSGLYMLRQLEFSIFDIMLHLNPKENYQTILDNVRNQIAVVKPPTFNRFANTFSHIFAGSYAAGYYSYKWAEVLAAEVYSKFDEISKDKYQELGQEFHNKILSQGGLYKMADNFRNFMGREPDINTLLHYSGIKNN